MGTLGGILLILLALWFWLDSARARELATGICEAACNEHRLQFLDQTVALRRLSLRWTARGVRLRRVYRFDFSEEGEGRRSGHITLVGIELEAFDLDLPPPPDNVVDLASRRRQ